MAGLRRKGSQQSEVRSRLIQGAREIMRDEGCAAVTAGRLAQKVGLGRHIVHYYFGTIEELLIEVIRCDGEEVRGQVDQMLHEEFPLRTLWALSNRITPQLYELIALAIRSETIRHAVQEYTRLIRNMVTAAIQAELDRRGLTPVVPPVAIGLVVVSISQALAGDSAIGLHDGHSEVEELLENWITGFELYGTWPLIDLTARSH